MPIESLLAARTVAALDKQIRTREYGIVSMREMVERKLSEGGSLRIGEIPDTAALRRAEQEYRQMSTSSDWVPTGNEKHPRTIRFTELRRLIDNPPTKTEYRLYSAGGWYSVIPKLVYDRFVYQGPHSCPKCGRAHFLDSFSELGEGEEAGREFYYCSESCREKH